MEIRRDDVAVVTGGASGIGSARVTRFARAGVHVAHAARTDALADAEREP